jgi:hypothetical protein
MKGDPVRTKNFFLSTSFYWVHGKDLTRMTRIGAAYITNGTNNANDSLRKTGRGQETRKKKYLFPGFRSLFLGSLESPFHNRSSVGIHRELEGSTVEGDGLRTFGGEDAGNLDRQGGGDFDGQGLIAVAGQDGITMFPPYQPGDLDLMLVAAE